MTVHDLLEALLLESANDAAVDLARGHRRHRATRSSQQMNERAPTSSASTTRSYANPVGLDDPGNYSIARDLATLARTLLREQALRADRGLAGGARSSRAATRAWSRTATTWSAAYPFVNGVKTGHTTQRRLRAGGRRPRAGRGRAVVSVVHGRADARPPATPTRSALLRWGLDRFRRVRVLAARAHRWRARTSKYRDEQAPARARAAAWS